MILTYLETSLTVESIIKTGDELRYVKVVAIAICQGCFKMEWSRDFDTMA